jgi:hypothetical protein
MLYSARSQIIHLTKLISSRDIAMHNRGTVVEYFFRFLVSKNVKFKSIFQAV